MDSKLIADLTPAPPTEFRLQPLVYVAGPITHPKGHEHDNAVRAMRVAEHIMAAADVTPVIPQLTVYWVQNMPDQHYGSACGLYHYERWIQMAMNWLLRCDAVFRMDGYSPGADREVELAESKGIPVFRSVKSLGAWVENGCP